MTGPDTEAARALADAIDRGDSPAARAETVHLLDSGVPAPRIIEDLLVPAQVAVGKRWQRAECSVAEEHVASAAVDAALSMVEWALPRPPTGPRIAVVCAETEWHTLPARMIAALARAAGAEVRFLGASIPADHLREYVVNLRPDVVAVSVSVPTHLPGAARTVAAARVTGAPVVVGGRAVAAHPGWARAVGADGHAASADQLLTAAGIGTERRPRSAPRWEAYLQLEAAREQAVNLGYGELSARLPYVLQLDPRRLERVREDLHHILDFAGASLVVDDQTLMSDFTAWLLEVLSVRGVPADTVYASYRALAESLPAPAAQLLRDQADQADLAR